MNDKAGGKYMEDIIKCYRFVQDDLSSENGELSWKIGEWNKVSGKIVCCSNGLHASLTPRDSISNVYGQRWFISEARGDIVKQDNKFAASEMMIVEEIPKIVLQRFAIWCAQDSLKYYEKKYPKDNRANNCIQALEDYLNGKITIDELIKEQKAAYSAVGGASGAAGRAIAAVIAASMSATTVNTAGWVNAAVAASYAAHAAASAIDAAMSAVDALDAGRNVESVAFAAVLADTASVLAHRAAGAGATAHASAVNAASNVAPADTAGDAYYSAYAAYSAHSSDIYYAAQDKKLSDMIDHYLSTKKK
ncbi:MAG: putative immunity protein [Methanobacterium sp.]|uniref:DUF7666 domain-containing protein n=1 Tax=Methanobacterium sp. TaxID=2164 RepID=UPI003C786EA5